MLAGALTVRLSVTAMVWCKGHCADNRDGGSMPLGLNAHVTARAEGLTTLADQSRLRAPPASGRHVRQVGQLRHGIDLKREQAEN